jgi:predicted HicB family RNase H-like nuclease
MSDKTMSYNGYCGSIEMSVEDDCLFGEILFINDLVTYEAKTPARLREAFENAVDYYLAKCKAENLKADKPFSGTFNVRIPKELHKQAAIKAASEGLRLNEYVKQCIELGVGETGTSATITFHNEHSEVISKPE